MTYRQGIQYSDILPTAVTGDFFKKETKLTPKSWLIPKTTYDLDLIKIFLSSELHLENGTHYKSTI